MAIRNISGALIAIFVLLLLAGCAQKESTIDVQGSYEMDYKPDQADVYLGVSLVQPTAAEAQNGVNTAIVNIIGGLKSLGIADDDIQTEQLSLYEERTYTNTGKSNVTGWRATQILKIRTTDLQKVGMIVDSGTKNGANQINSINFGLSTAKEAEYRQDVLAQAAKNAGAKAESIAGSLNVSLGKIKSVTENSFNYVPYVYSLKAQAAPEAVTESATVLPSDVTISATVTIEYYIQ